MPLKIRLARAGAKKRPYYRIVVADSRSPRDAADRVQLDTEKVQAWIAKGAQPTDRVLRFLDAAGLAKREPRNNPNKAKPGKKRQEREAAAAAAAAEAKPAA